MLRGYAGAALHYAGRYAEAARMYEGTLQLDSQYTAAWIGLCKAYTALGRFEQAIDACEQVAKTGAAEPPFVESQMVQIHADAGRPREARRHLDVLLEDVHVRPRAAIWRSGLRWPTPACTIATKAFAGSTSPSRAGRRACSTPASTPASIRCAPTRATRSASRGWKRVERPRVGVSGRLGPTVLSLER